MTTVPSAEHADRSPVPPLFDRLLDEDTPGRPLDFLTQELAREANTVASKSADVAIAHAVVELKTQVERLKELVQNVE